MSIPGSPIPLLNKRKQQRIDGGFQVILSVLQNFLPDAQESLDCLAKICAQVCVFVGADVETFKENVGEYFNVISKLTEEAQAKEQKADA